MTARRKPTSESGTALDDVPLELPEWHTEFVALADDFCDQFLNGNYKQVCRKMAVGLCQKGSPVLRGKPATDPRQTGPGNDLAQSLS